MLAGSKFLFAPVVGQAGLGSTELRRLDEALDNRPRLAGRDVHLMGQPVVIVRYRTSRDHLHCDGVDVGATLVQREAAGAIEPVPWIKLKPRVTAISHGPPPAHWRCGPSLQT